MTRAGRRGRPDVERYDPFDGRFGFSLAVRHGGTLHLSGLAGVRDDGSVPDALDDQLRLTYANAANILGEHGCTLDDVVEQTIYVVGEPAEAFDSVERVRHEVFRSGFPAGAVVGAAWLADPRLLVEVKLSAAIPS